MVEGVSKKIKIKRRNDLIDYFSDYNIIVNEKTYKIKSGETKYLNLNKEINNITVKFLYFKKKVEINSKSEKSLLIRTFFNRNWFLFFLILFTVTLFLMSFTEYDFNFWYSAISYLGIAFFSVIIYHCTIGMNNYISIDFID